MARTAGKYPAASPGVEFFYGGLHVGEMPVYDFFAERGVRPVRQDYFAGVAAELAL